MSIDISKQDILDAQKKWSNALIAIGDAYENNKDYRSLAAAEIAKLYAYNDSDHAVLFKPTRACKQPFRPTLQGALSYFVAGDDNFSEDTGFALRPWVEVVFDNHDIVSRGGISLAMGTYTFTSLQGDKVKVEYTFGYSRDSLTGDLKIILHHSSIPFKEQLKK